MKSLPPASKHIFRLTCVCIFAVIINTAATAQTKQYVTWSSIVNGSNLGNGTVHKTSSGTWDFAASATQTLLSGDGYVESNAANYNQSINLSGVDGAARSLVIGTGGWAAVYENGVEIAATSGHGPGQTFSAHAAGDRYRIEITNGTLRYIRYRASAREVLYTSTSALPAYPLSFSLGMSPQNAEWQKSVIAQLTRRSTWSSIANGIDLGNGSVRKTSTGTWDFSANSSQTLVRGDGYFESTASYYNQSIWVGGSDGASGALVVGTGGWAAIYEAGVEVAGTYGHPANATFAPHAAGDRYRLEIINGKLNYVRYRAGVRSLMYASTANLPAYPLGFGVGASFQNSEWQNSVFAQTTQSVSWSTITNGIDLGAGSVRKTSTGAWDFSAGITQQLVYGSGYLESTASYYNQSFIVGGSDGTWGAIVVGTGGWAAIYENNVEVAATSGHGPSETIGAHAAGDRYRIEVSRGKLRYVRYRAGVRTLMFTSTNALPAYPLSFSLGASFQNSEWQSTIFSDNLPEHNDAAFISQTVPTTMTPSQSYNVSVTMRNTGASTWTPDGDFQLGAENLSDNQTWGLNRVNLGTPVVPGSDATFNFAVTAPTSPGAYHFQWRMVQQGVQRFGSLTDDVTVTTVNNPPTVSLTAPANNASFTTGSTVTLNANASDSDGTVSKVEFFQGSTKLGEDTTSPYSFSWTNVAAGSYTLTARATDNGGAIATSTGVNITVVTPNQPPLANTGGPYSGTTLTAVQFNGGGSSDPDGIISSYQWSFGDGGNGTGAAPTHMYATAGTYTVTLTVTDNAAATNTQSTTATIANRPPVANTGGPYTGTTGTAVQFNGGSSSDQDGTIASYSWNFGDNTTGSGSTPTHTYATANTYTVTLTVTDNNGATNTATTTATIANRPPVANAGGPYTSTTGSAVHFNGGSSSDPDGTISSYAWNFGDTATGSGAAPTHTYTTAGTKTVALTVTDNNGATNTATTTATITGFSDVRLDPLNETGSAGANPLSRNFNWSIPLVSLPGRSNLDLGLSLSYNSLATWTKNGGYISFDDDQGFPGPGFRLGFPIIQSLFYNSQAGKYSFLLITPSGGRVELRQVGSSSLYQSVDSSYLLLDTSNNQMKIRATDGSQMTYVWNGTNYVCAEIKDRNGNFITVNYDGLGRIDTVIDTLSRTIKFNYTNGDLNSITQSWTVNGQAQTHTWASFSYTNQTIQTSFSNLTVVGPANNSAVRVLTQVTFANNSHFNFDYTSWGQVWKISQYASGSPSDYLINYRAYNLRGSPMAPTGVEPDCPRFTERRDWAENWNRDANGVAQEALTQFTAPTSVTIPNTSTTGSVVQVTLPDGTSQKIYYGSANTVPAWKNGLVLLTETYDNASTPVKQRWVITSWEQDDLNAGFPLNPRPTETNIYDPAGNHARTRTEYAAINPGDRTTVNLPQNSYQYQADANTVLKRSRVEYITDSVYLSRRIIGLPSLTLLCDGSQGEVPCTTQSGAAIFAKTTLQYDESGSIQGSDAPVQHDNPNFVAGRANLSSVTRYDVSNVGAPLTSSAQYNTAGAVVATHDALNHGVTISYLDSFSDGGNTRNTLAYPTTVTDPDGFSSTAQYNFDFGAVTRTQTPLPNVTNNQAGPAQTIAYDSIGRLQRVTNLVNNAYQRYEYGPNFTQTYSTVNTVADEAYSLQVFDGAGRTIAKATNHPGSTGGFSGQLVIYDAMGRVVKQSNPTETTLETVSLTNSLHPYSWTAAGDDAAPNGGSGWVYTQQSYDWKARPRVTTNADNTTKEASYAGCGCAGGEVVTLTDEVGRREKVYSDILGRQWKTEVLNWDSSVYATTTSALNGRDQVTLIRRWAGAENSGGAYQDTTMSYDGYGRLQTSHVPEQQDSNGNPTYTTWSYNSDDTIYSITDARGVFGTYGYNNRHLVTSINYSVPPGSNIPATPNITFGYDAAGSRTSMTDGLGSQSYSYDSLSRMISETRTFSDPSNPQINGVSKTLSYDYNLAGELKIVTDPWGATVNYGFDSSGRLSNINGSGYGSATQFLNSTQYRAWGTLKSETYGNGLTQSATYNNRMQMTSFDVRKPSGELQISTTTQFYQDGQVKFSHNALDERFDRAFDYDQVARATQAYSGSEARDFINNTNSGNPTGPYRQNYQFNPFDQISQQTNRLWSDNETTTSTFTNNRNSAWSYDASGFVTRDDSASYTRDAAGLLVQADAEVSHGTYSFDGTGRVSKTLLRTPGFHNTRRTITTYYLHSTVLAGLAVAELNATGQKTKRYLYVGLRELAEEAGGNVTWLHEEPVTGSRGNSTSAGDYFPKAEFNADGIDVGFAPPDSGGFDIPEPIAPFGYLGLGSSCSVGNPNCVTCYVDGFEHDCGHVMQLAQAGALQIQVQNSRGDTKLVDLDVVLGQLVTREWIDTRGRRPPPEKLPDPGIEVDGNGTIVTNGYIPSGYWRYTTVSTATFDTGERRFAHAPQNTSTGQHLGTGKPPCPPVPQAPSSANIDDNIKQEADSLANVRTQMSMPNGEIGDRAFKSGLMFSHMLNFATAVMPYGPWDYKRQGEQYEAFGNFNFGAAGSAAGITQGRLLRGAGFVQKWAGDSYGDGGRVSLANVLSGTGGEEPFEDQVRDQENIKAGINYYQHKFVLKDCQ
jgi:YD repeat-containing protein